MKITFLALVIAGLMMIPCGAWAKGNKGSGHATVNGQGTLQSGGKGNMTVRGSGTVNMKGKGVLFVPTGTNSSVSGNGKKTNVSAGGHSGTLYVGSGSATLSGEQTGFKSSGKMVMKGNGNGSANMNGQGGYRTR